MEVLAPYIFLSPSSSAARTAVFRLDRFTGAGEMKHMRLFIYISHCRQRAFDGSGVAGVFRLR